MDDSWACSAAYVYALHLSPSDRAWEYLRRNPRYHRDWAHHRRGGSQRIAARWGLAALIDPTLDARQVSPVWAIDDFPPVMLVRDQMLCEQANLPELRRFSLWSLAGRKSLVAEGAGIHLVVRSSKRAMQVRIGDRLNEGDQFAYQIPPICDDQAAWSALVALREIMCETRGGKQNSAERPGRADFMHAHALQALDGAKAGASQRQLALAIFGRACVGSNWQADSALRAQVRYLIRKARALMNGQFYRLIECTLASSTCRRPARCRDRAAPDENQSDPTA